jgi:hypothetical protein
MWPVTADSERPCDQPHRSHHVTSSLSRVAGPDPLAMPASVGTRCIAVTSHGGFGPHDRRIRAGSGETVRAGSTSIRGRPCPAIVRAAGPFGPCGPPASHTAAGTPLAGFTAAGPPFPHAALARCLSATANHHGCGGSPVALSLYCVAGSRFPRPPFPYAALGRGRPRPGGTRHQKGAPSRIDDGKRMLE